jgi:hypothetical protein
MPGRAARPHRHHPEGSFSGEVRAGFRFPTKFAASVPGLGVRVWLSDLLFGDSPCYFMKILCVLSKSTLRPNQVNFAIHRLPLCDPSKSTLRSIDFRFRHPPVLAPLIANRNPLIS